MDSDPKGRFLHEESTLNRNRRFISDGSSCPRLFWGYKWTSYLGMQRKSRARRTTAVTGRRRVSTMGYPGLRGTIGEKEREAKLRADALVRAVDPQTVVCRMCERTLVLSYKSCWDPEHWIKHRGRCSKRTSPDKIAQLLADGPEVMPNSQNYKKNDMRSSPEEVVISAVDPQAKVINVADNSKTSPLPRHVAKVEDKSINSNLLAPLEEFSKLIAGLRYTAGSYSLHSPVAPQITTQLEESYMRWSSFETV